MKGNIHSSMKDSDYCNFRTLFPIKIYMQPNKNSEIYWTDIIRPSSRLGYFCYGVKSLNDLFLISFQLETYWSSIRVEQITQGLVSAPVTKVNSLLSGCGYDLFDARDNYLKLKGEGKDHVFERTVDRNVNYFIEAVGNRDLSDYTSTDGARFRDFLLDKGLVVSSIKRIFSSLGPIIKLMIQ